MNGIIRPPRAEYSMNELGPAQFTYKGRRFQRRDFTLTNPRDQTLECSHWEPVQGNRPNEKLPCVVYMHGNAGCRVAALEMLAFALSSGMTVFALDFAGSGKSGGDWVSLGYFERDDLATVVGHLRECGTVSTIGLWGRSMVSFTSLQFFFDPSMNDVYRVPPQHLFMVHGDNLSLASSL